MKLAFESIHIAKGSEEREILFFAIHRSVDMAQAAKDAFYNL